MERKIKITASPKEVAELLFELDNEQVAEVFSQWKKLFDEEYERRKTVKESIWIFDLNHFMMHVIDKLDDDGKDFFRSAYSSLVYKLFDNASKKHLTDLHLG